MWPAIVLAGAVAAVITASPKAQSPKVQSPQIPLPHRVADCLDRARPALLHHLQQTDLGELALCCLAAVHDGIPAKEPAFAAALERLGRAKLDDTYGLSLRLMVLAELPDFPRRNELAAADAAQLLRRQTTGGFSYHEHDGWWDLSNTQYAVLGLRAAEALGVEVPEQMWRLLYQAVVRMQLDDGGFTYRPGQGKPSCYESMAVAGIAVLQVAGSFVASQQPPWTAADWQRHDARVARTWQWLAARKESLGSRRVHCCYYFHYGLERAAILSDVERVGDVDWYGAGALMMCDEQERGGGFRGGDEFRPPGAAGPRGHAVDTAFAVLFLRRKFQKTLGAVTGQVTLRSAGLDDQATAADRAAAVAADTAFGRRAVPQLLALLHSDVLARRQAAVLALFAVSGEDFGLHPYRSRGDDAEAIRRAELWWLRARAQR